MVMKKQLYQPETFHDLLQYAGAQYGNLPYVIENSSTKTYNEFIDDVVRVSRVLLDRGYANERILVSSKNSYELIVMYTAIMTYIGTLVCASNDWKAYDMHHAIDVSQPAKVICGNDQTEIFDQLGGPYETIDSIFDAAKSNRYDQSKSETTALQPMSPDGIALMVFTTGSSALPKLVPISFRNLYTNAQTLYERVSTDIEDVFYLFLPMHHIYSLTCVVYAAFVTGARLFVAQNVHAFAKEVVIARPTVIVGVPLFFERLVAKIPERERRIAETISKIFHTIHAPIWLRRHVFKKMHVALGGRLRVMTSGAAPLSLQTKRLLSGMGFSILEGYGMTEASGVVSVTKPQTTPDTSMGTILEVQSVKVISPDTNGVGEIAIKGDNVMRGYWKSDGYDRNDFTKDGYYRTGDRGWVDGKNRIYIEGRLDKMIVLSSGENISRQEMTQLLKRIDGIDKVYFSEEDGHLAATIYSHKSYQVLSDAVRELNQTLPRYKQILSWEHIGDYTIQEMK